MIGDLSSNPMRTFNMIHSMSTELRTCSKDVKIRPLTRYLHSPPPIASSSNGSFRRSDYTGQGFTSYYDADAPTQGPLADASMIGAPRITPRLLKQHLDEFVIGQDRAKKMLSVAVYNHYLRIEELKRREEEEQELLAQQSRREYVRHPVEDEFPGQQSTVNLHFDSSSLPNNPKYSGNRYNPAPIVDYSSLSIEKSNILLLGPSGTGKTLISKTLARILEVPFSISDCTPFTQAGYIGEDAEVCVQRLLAAANYDVARAERGIIVLDEIDKIATARVSHGKDVSGEGVQQALLKIIEGTTVQVQSKNERSSSHYGSGGRSQNMGPTSNPQSGGNMGSQQSMKGEVYNVQTDNILFICTGAFIGLHKTVMDRLSKGSIGFGAQMRAFPDTFSTDPTDPTLPVGNKDDEELFRKHLPFFEPRPRAESGDSPSPASPEISVIQDESSQRYNTLDLTTPVDLQRFGLIPELVGRVPIICALAPLSLSSLVRVLTEPRNSLVAQYVQLFALSGMELRFTSAALFEIAKGAQGMGTGARGLRAVMERLLGETQFETPGAGVRYVLVTEAAAKREEPCRWYGRGSQVRFHTEAADEEEEWERRREKGGPEELKPGFESFEQYRERVTIAGSG